MLESEVDLIGLSNAAGNWSRQALLGLLFADAGALLEPLKIISG
jgi:hypothetical protein